MKYKKRPLFGKYIETDSKKILKNLNKLEIEI